jgi:hypothetical protein
MFPGHEELAARVALLLGNKDARRSNCRKSISTVLASEESARTANAGVFG